MTTSKPQPVKLETANHPDQSVVGALKDPGKFIDNYQPQPMQSAYQSILVSDATPFRWDHMEVFSLCVMVLIFGLIALKIASSLIQKNYPINEVLRMVGIIVILCLTAFIVPAGYGKGETSNLLTLFGTVAGYLVGKLEREKIVLPLPETDSNIESKA